jgi:hypothetical protein
MPQPGGKQLLPLKHRETEADQQNYTLAQVCARDGTGQSARPPSQNTNCFPAITTLLETPGEKKSQDGQAQIRGRREEPNNLILRGGGGTSLSNRIWGKQLGQATAADKTL